MEDVGESKMTHTVCTTDGCTRYVFDEKEQQCSSCVKRIHVLHLAGDFAHADMECDFIIDEIAQMLHRESVKLTDQEIRDICTIYHESHGLNAESLEESNQLYMGIDHVNNMLLDATSGVGLSYK